MIKLFKFLKKLSSSSYNFSLEQHIGSVNINLGCGNRPIQGFTNVDLYNTRHADLVFDISEELPFPPNSCDLIFSDNVFEHIDGIIDLVFRCHLALKPGGKLIIRVPYFKSRDAFVDPTHTNFFTIHSMDYYVQGTKFNDLYSFGEPTFKSLKVYFDPESSKTIVRKFIELLALHRSNYYENSLISNLFVFSNIIYVLEK